MTLLWPRLARAALFVCGLTGLGLALSHLPPGLNPEVFAASFVGQGGSGQALFVLLVVGLCAAGMPRQIAAFGAGYAFGLWPGIPLVLAGLVGACAVDFLWARLVARDWARRRILHRLGGRLAKLDAFLAANPFTAVLVVRLLPVGSNVGFSLLAGVSAIGAVPFLAASALGYIPQTLIFALLGSGIGVADWLRIGLGIALFLASILLGALLLRRYRARTGLSESGT